MSKPDSPDFEKQYRELVDALCSASWLGRNRHDSVLKLAQRLRDSQLHIIPMQKARVNYTAADGTEHSQEVELIPHGYPKLCSRRGRHIGPCNGYPRNTCPGAQSCR